MPSTSEHVESYALLLPQAFSERMNTHWTAPVPHGLGQCSSSALRTLWKIMGDNFQQSIVEAAKGTQSPWRILQPPTGTGKTQGTCVYAAMQADHNRETNAAQRPVGILIVTRLKEEADKLKETVNRIAGRSVAAVDHSGDRASPEVLQQSDVLIITHEAFLNAKRGLKEHQRAPCERRTRWRGGLRLLTIVDEALANVVDESHATTENLALAIGHIPFDVRAALPEQVAVLEQMHRVLLSYAETDEGSDNAMSLLWSDGGAPACVDFDPLRTAMSSLRYDRLVYGRDNPSDRTRLAERVDETLKAAQATLDQFAYYAKTGERHSINSAALGMPLDTPGPVVLDATASANFLWDLFEERHVRPAVPSHARNYGNVTLHLARASGLGKHNMIERIGERWPRVQRAIEAELGPERSVFMCMHKDTEGATKGYGARFKRFAVGHWGAVDGRNDWQECDAAVILGLPYRPQTWATNIFCALQGAQDDKWLRSPAWKQYTNVRKVMEDRQLAVSVIQAINRICCRRVIDAAGNCPVADIFIVLPHDKTGEAVLDAVRADMPRLNIVPWDFELDGPKVRQPRSGSSHARLISYMANVPPGTLSLSSVQHELRIGKSGLSKLRETLNNAGHETTKALRALGVQYIPGGGRGTKSYLQKKTA
jgi:hypothetical protein